MNGFTLSTDSWLLFVAGGISLGLAIYSFCHRSKSFARLLAFALLAEAWWTIWSGLSLAPFESTLKTNFARTAYAGVLACTPFFLLFIAQAAGHGDWVNPRNVILVFLIPITVLLPSAWAFGEGARAGDYRFLSMQGLSSWPSMVFTFIAISLTTALSMLKWRVAPSAFFRRRAVLVALGVLPACFAGYSLIAGGKHNLGSLIIPVTFLLSNTALATAILRYRLFSLKSISYEDLMESLPDGVVALDEHLRIVGFNPATRVFFNQPERAVGRPAADSLSAYPPLLQVLQECDGNGHMPDKTIIFNPATGLPSAPLEICLTTVKNRGGLRLGYELKFHKIEAVKAELENERRERLMAQSLSRAALTFTRTMDVEETLHRILEECVVNLPVTWATLQMIDPQGRAKIISMRGPTNPEMIRWLRSMRPVVAETATLAWMASTGQPLIIPDLLEPEVDRRSFNLGRSYMGVPLMVADDVVGFINLYHSQPEFYSTSHLKTLSSFAELASTLLDNDRNFQITQDLANTDGLTGLNNRRYFFLLAAKEMRRSIRFKKNLSLLMIDLDYFKEINDAFGHQVGDNALRHLGQLIRESLRDVDIAGRYGGDEFAILMPETSEQNAEILGNRIRERIRDGIFVTETGEVRFTVSLGLAARSEGHKLFDDLLEAADRALYQAKRNGRNRLEIIRAESEIAI